MAAEKSTKKAPLLARLEAAEKLAAQESEKGGMGYLQHVVIDSKPEPRPFRLLAHPWQWERARRIVPAFDWSGGFNPGYSGPRSFAESYPRGHDKTSFLARLCNHVLAFGRKRVQIIAGAGDEEQAALITSAMRIEASLNPWLNQRLKFFKTIVKGTETGSELKIQAADAKSAFGLRGDIYVLDEITHWKKSDFWEALLSGRAKMPGALFFIITNAGLLSTWQWEMWCKLKADPTWAVYEAPGQMQSWMSQEQIANDRKLLPSGQAKRLYDNQWIDPAEESGYLTRPEAEACEQLGVDLGLTQQEKGKPNREYWISVDYGPKRDRTVMCVGHQEPDGAAKGIIVVDQMVVWQGSPSAPIQLSAVRAWIEDMRTRFYPCNLVLDPYQMEDIAQYYEQRMRVVRFEARGGKSNYEMAACLRSLICNRRIAWYKTCGSLIVNGLTESLIDELCSLVVKQMTYGYRIDHELTAHDDRAVSLGMMCVEILKSPVAVDWVKPPGLEAQPVSPLAQFRKQRDSSPRILYGVDWRAEQGRRFRRP